MKDMNAIQFPREEKRQQTGRIVKQTTKRILVRNEYTRNTKILISSPSTPCRDDSKSTSTRKLSLKPILSKQT